jgi:hypothetical protein
VIYSFFRNGWVLNIYPEKIFIVQPVKFFLLKNDRRAMEETRNIRRGHLLLFSAENGKGLTARDYFFSPTVLGGFAQGLMA